MKTNEAVLGFNRFDTYKIIEHNKNLLVLLECASAFAAGKNEPRHYLKAVLIRNVDTDCHIVAADGHKLAKIVIKDYQTDLPERLIVQSIKDAIKVKNFCMLSEDKESKDSQYPDYTRLMPAESETCEGLPVINASYLADMSAAYVRVLKKLYGCKFAGLKLKAINKDKGNLFGNDIAANVSIDFVIMPMRL